MFRLFIALFLFSAAVSAVTLTSKGISYEINDDQNSPDFGSVVHTANKDKRSDVTWFSYPSGVKAVRTEHVSDSEIVLLRNLCDRNNTFSELRYTVEDGVLRCDMKFYTSQGAEYPDGLALHFSHPFQTISASTPHGKAVEHSINQKNRNLITTSQILSFKGSPFPLIFLVRNPFHSYWKIEKENLLSYEILPTIPAKSRYSEGPGTEAFSVLRSSDTLFRSIEILPDTYSSVPIMFSEIPNGFSQGFTMYWDELPHPDDKWSHMTTADDRRSGFGHYYVKLLENHPRMKMGYLLLTDPLVWWRNGSFEGWRADSHRVMKDSLEKFSGNWSVLLTSDSIRTVRISQYIRCKPESSYELSYWVKTDSVEGGEGAYGEVYSNNVLLKKISGDFGSSGWKRKTCSFTTGKTDTVLMLILRIQQASGNAFFDNVTLVDKCDRQRNLAVNGTFESGMSDLHYTDPRRHYADVRGPFRSAERAPQEYRDHLVRIEQHVKKYGWEDRVNIGSHGCHHTPHLEWPDQSTAGITRPGAEFQFYDPFGDSLRIKRILEDYAIIGLTEKSFKYFRAPCLTYTKSLLHELTRNGVIFHDLGFVPYSSCYTSKFIQRDGKILWNNDLAAWFDFLTDNPDQIKLQSYLDEGKFAQTGGHPGEVMRDSSGKYQFDKVDAFFTNLEKKYPNMGYLFPDEYADNAGSLYAMRMGKIIHTGNVIKAQLIGSSIKGTTLLFSGRCRSIRLDGQPLSFENRGRTNFIILPELPAGTHELTITELEKIESLHDIVNTEIAGDAKPNLGSFYYRTAGNTLHISSPVNSVGVLKIYGMNGRLLFNQNLNLLSGYTHFQIPSELARGCLIGHLEIGGNSANFKLLLN